jgi:hypothetical protein
MYKKNYSLVFLLAFVIILLNMAYKLSEIFKDSPYTPFLMFLKTHKIYFLSIFVSLFIFYINSFNSVLLSDEFDAYNYIKSMPIHNFINLLLGPFFQLHVLFQVFLFPNFSFYRLFYVFIHFFNILLSIYLFSRFININVLKVFGVFIVSHSLVSESLVWVSASHNVMQSLTILSIFFLAVKYKDTGKLHYLFLIYFINFPVIIDNKSQSLPLVLIIFCTLFLKIRFKDSVLCYGPLFIFNFLYLIFQNSRIQERIQSLNSSSRIEFVNFDFTSPFISLTRSFELLLFPVNITFMYLEKFSQNQIYFYIFCAILVLGVYVYLFIYLKKIFTFLTIGLLICLYMFSPVSISWYLANRYLYFFTFMGVLVISIFLYLLLKRNFKLGVAVTVIYLVFHSIILNMKINDWSSGSKLFQENERIVGNHDIRLSIYRAQFLTIEMKLSEGEEVFNSILERNTSNIENRDFWKYYFLNLLLQGKLTETSEIFKVYGKNLESSELTKIYYATSIILSRIANEYNLESKIRFEAYKKDINQEEIDGIINFYYGYFKSVI